MAQNDFQTFAGSGVEGTDLLSISKYTADSDRLLGNQAGTARRALMNRAMRQASIMGAAVAKMIVDELGADVIDDGTTATIAANLKSVITARVNAGVVAKITAPYTTVVSVASYSALPATGDIKTFYRITDETTLTTAHPYISYVWTGTAYLGIDRGTIPSQILLTASGAIADNDYTVLYDTAANTYKKVPMSTVRAFYAQGVIGDRQGFNYDITADTASISGVGFTDLCVKSDLTDSAVSAFINANNNLSLNTATTGLGGLDAGTMPTGSTSSYLAIYALYNPSTQTAGLIGQVISGRTTASENFTGTQSSSTSGYTLSALLTIIPITSAGLMSACSCYMRTVARPAATVYTGTTGTAGTISFPVENGAPGNAIKVHGTMSGTIAAGAVFIIYLYSNANNFGAVAMYRNAYSASTEAEPYSLMTIPNITPMFSVTGGTASYITISEYEF